MKFKTIAIKIKLITSINVNFLVFLKMLVPPLFQNPDYATGYGLELNNQRRESGKYFRNIQF